MNCLTCVLRVPLRIRPFSTSCGMKASQREKIKEYQKLFQRDNGLPVHLKRGASDRILYQGTLGLCIGGTCYVLYTLYEAAFTK